jgi:hypothetical protein
MKNSAFRHPKVRKNVKEILARSNTTRGVKKTRTRSVKPKKSRERYDD